MKLKDSSKNINLGFTLIELLVSLLVISILIALGYANFRKYSQKQALWAVARQIEGDLRLAQSYAMAGKDALSCGSNSYLSGYRLKKESESSYSVVRVCSSSDESEVFKRDIPAGFEINNFDPVLFKSVSGVVNTDTYIDIKVRRIGTIAPYILIRVLSTGLTSLSYNE